MGREIRRVPMGWEHPKTEDGLFQPMYDCPFNEAFDKWISGRNDWIADKDGNRTEAQNLYNNGEYMHYEELEGVSPDPDYYRPEWPEDAKLGYCIYETVTEGTPRSPVFESLSELEDWLVGNGHSRENAHAFCKIGYVPSAMISTAGPSLMGIDAASTIYNEGDNE